MIRTRLPLALLLLVLALPGPAYAEDERPAVQLAQFGTGAGPADLGGGHFRLLDEADTRGQSNALAFESGIGPEAETITLSCGLRVLKGGDGGAFVFLDTREYGVRGPAPFVKSWVEPNLKGTFAVGIDVHSPSSKEQFSPWGNYRNEPEREISLHFDGREVVKRVAPTEFRGDFAELKITLRYVAGGAEVSVGIAGHAVYERYFMAHLLPYPMRLAVGAGTRADASTRFDVKDLVLSDAPRPSNTPRRRPPLHVDVFNRVLTNNGKTRYEATVDLPPAAWAFGRVILTLDIHDAHKDWDEWDRNGEISIQGEDGTWHGIVPFITSYRTPCHWKIDVTHFRPYLTGQRTIRIAAGTSFYKNRGYMLSVSLDFHHGTLDLEPYRVVPLWVGTARYKSAENHFQDFFTPKTVAIPAEARAARVFTTTTGHSQIGEWTPSKRTLVFAPQKGGEASAEKRFPNTLWKDDVYLNPNRPQFGTWQYSRAGWAPGDVVRPWWVDLSDCLEPGQEAEFRYETEAYVFEEGRNPAEKQVNQASHVVRSYVILYRPSTSTVTAPTLRITSVSKDSNAAKAGIKKGDYLASYAGKTLDSVDDLRAAIQAAAGTESIGVVVFRGLKRLELTLQPGRMGISLAQP